MFIFTSDNGAEASGSDDPGGFASRRASSSLGYHTDYERLGLKGSFNTISPSFASAAASPLAFYKFYAGEGGLRVPLIISGMPLDATPTLTHAFAWATDITPTMLSIAGVEHSSMRYGGRPVLPISGRDLSPLLRGEVDRVYGEQDTVGYELTGHAAFFQGDYKLVRNQPPVGDAEWRLYNIVSDPGEVIDLKEAESSRYQRMLAGYAQFTRENGVLPLPQGYSQSGQLISNFLAERFRVGIVVALLTLLILLPFLVAYRIKRKSA